MSMYVHETQVRVRYGETDQMGYVYYGYYAQYYEVGRVELMRTLGVRYKDLEEKDGILLPVVSMQARYLRPGLYDELLTVKTTLKELPGEFITFYHDILNEKGELINAAHVRLCFFDAIAKVKVQPPESLMLHLKPYFDTST